MLITLLIFAILWSSSCAFKAVSNCRLIASNIGPKVSHMGSSTNKSGKSQRKRRHGGGFTKRERHQPEDPMDSGYGRKNGEESISLLLSLGKLYYLIPNYSIPVLNYIFSFTYL
uniref:Secreted protein n=1 Tax=Heterorhabditis bacteriophora TaxID=37862 RepID=A0A1I7WKC0_HETBA